VRRQVGPPKPPPGRAPASLPRERAPAGYSRMSQESAHAGGSRWRRWCANRPGSGILRTALKAVVVERTLAWMMRWRRLVRDYERPPEPTKRWSSGRWSASCSSSSHIHPDRNPGPASGNDHSRPREAPAPRRAPQPLCRVRCLTLGLQRTTSATVCESTAATEAILGANNRASGRTFGNEREIFITLHQRRSTARNRYEQRLTTYGSDGLARGVAAKATGCHRARFPRSAEAPARCSVVLHHRGCRRGCLGDAGRP
jgi:hypothetical protein